jgi:hypothetical protein
MFAAMKAALCAFNSIFKAEVFPIKPRRRFAVRRVAHLLSFTAIAFSYGLLAENNLHI